MTTLLSMEPKVKTTTTLPNDKAFAFLERFTHKEFTDTTLLFNIKIELAVAGIAFKLEEWLDLIKIIILNLGGMGINAIKAAWELKQAKVAPVVPLLEDAATWQLVLCWATDDSLSFSIFLTEMEKFGNRYQFDKWKSIFDQVFEASWEGTTVEVIRAAMAEHGVIKPSSRSSCRSHHSLHPAKHPRMSTSASQYLDISAQEDEEDKEEDKEDELDNEVDCHPRVTMIAPSGHMNLTQQLKSLFHHYGGKGSAEGSRAMTQPRVFKVMLPSGSLKNEIAYVQHIEGNSVYILIVPWNLPYISSGENSVVCWELFDVDLAYKHGLEVTLTLSPEGHTITHCLQSQYHCSLLHGYFRRCNVEPVNLPTPEQIAWFIVLGVDPTLVTHTLTYFSAQRWQVGDCGKIQAGEFVNKVAYITMDIQGESVIVCLDNPTLELPASLEISIYNFKCKFHSGNSVDVIASPHHGFEGMVLSVDMIKEMALLCGNDRQQESQGIQIEEHFIEPGDAHIKKVFNDKDAKGDKGKSKAQVPEVPGEDSNGDGADNEVIIFSKKKGWDISKGDLIQVICGPAVDVEGVVCSIDLITATLTLESEDSPWVHEHHIGCEVWIISGLNKGYSGMLRSVGQTSCTVAIHSGTMTFKNTAVISRFGMLLDGTLLDPGPSNPWVTTPNDVNAQCCSEQEQQSIDYGCMSWLFDNDFCNFSKWHVCLRVRLAYNHGTLGKQVVCTTISDHFFSEKHGMAPPGHVLATMTSSTASTIIEHHTLPPTQQVLVSTA
ncbi:hypothetical protein F5J12DRAFT_786916 [Pisolithus orientalis]|uniref:uncharacterized protein n=1 Tax=Pisolithus orientalis TaxID=936130 RepID=UPI0022247686|nr:uncharacterized protein F5J12DRAFT_786916 [Pisolithus orientalis]KAI5988225.1 hypothetical protein F5J12DRAFT_786916 [Pisolithus orientalis]